MAKFKYEIIYDIDRDIWNWYYGAKYSNNGQQLKNKTDRKMISSLRGLNKREAEKTLRPFLRQKKGDLNSSLNEFIGISEQEFSDKFTDACLALESITNKPMASSSFKFFVTTFPRMVVFFDESIIFMYAKIDNKLWGMPIDGFLHEGLHFQVNKYYREDPKSPVSKLSDNEFYILNESLTVILDESLKPIITLPDCSYQEFSEFRNVLHDHWKQNRDFGKLISYGLKRLPEFVAQFAG